jgi:hypothetical protein
MVKGENGGAPPFWEIGNHESAIFEAGQRKIAPNGLRAGAAFHLAKLHTAHGGWERSIPANTNLSLRRVREYMATVEHVVERLKYPVGERAWLALIGRNDPRDAEWAAGFLDAVNDAIRGLTHHQIEIHFGVSKPKQIGAGSGRSVEDHEKTGRELAVQYLADVCEGINALARLGKHLDGQDRQRLAWACYDGLTRCLPDWPLKIAPPRCCISAPRRFKLITVASRTNCVCATPMNWCTRRFAGSRGRGSEAAGRTSSPTTKCMRIWI